MKKTLLSFSIALISISGYAVNHRPGAADPSAVKAQGENLRLSETTIPRHQTRAADDDAWNSIGTGSFTDVVMCSMFGGIQPLTMQVEIEQSATDKNTYRIQYPYANYNFTQYDYAYFSEEEATPMVFHVINDSYAWFETFNTGIHLDTYSADGYVINGFVELEMQVAPLIQQYGIDVVYSTYPNAFCKYEEGNITLPARFMSNGQFYYNIFAMVSNHDFAANTSGSFHVQMPGSQDLDPDYGWTALPGKGKYTDAFTEAFAVNGVTPEYQTWEVEIQQNNDEPDYYRVVNPYAGFKNYLGDNFSYDSSTNYYIYIHLFPDINKGVFDDFFTGLQYMGEGIGITTDAGYLGAEYGYDMVLFLIPDCFPIYENGVLTLAPYYIEDGEQWPCALAWIGPYSDENNFYPTNSSGKFRLEFPSGGDNAVDAIDMNEDSTAEYFNLQGLRILNPQPGQIVIVREGSKTTKQVFRK